MKPKCTFIGIVLFLNVSICIGQTCCSGGVPMSGNLGLPAGDQGDWQLSVNYDVNILNTLKDGNSTLADNTRKRTTHSILTELGYSISEKFSIDAFFSYVRQERKLTPIGQPENLTVTNGIGDAVLLFKYKFYRNYQIGIGLKMPLGRSDMTDIRGITLNADLQPGSGAWDIIYWFNGSQTLGFRKSMTFNNTLIYRSTGSNDSYFGNQIYEFGNELQILAGIADRLVFGSFIIDPAISLKYRNVSNDINDGNEVPSTGGEWIFIRPALTYNITPAFKFQINVELPLYAYLEGTQVTPTMRLNTGILVRFNNKNRTYDTTQIK